MTRQDFEVAARAALDDVWDLLVTKNAEYGNAALEPRPVFSLGSSVERLHARLDEKLARVATATAAGQEPSEDTLLDLEGCLVLLRIARRERR